MQRRHRLFSISAFSPIFLFYAVAVLALLSGVAANPAPIGQRRTTSSVCRRQAGDPTKQPVTVQTVQVTDTSLGPVTETCQITLSPAQGPEGQDLVKEVKQCTFSIGANNAQNPGNGGNPPPPPPDSSASASATDSATAPDSAASAASTTDASSASAASSADGSASSAPASGSAADSASSSAAPTSVPPPAVSANGVSSIPLASVTALASSSAADGSNPSATAAGAAASATSDNQSATAAPDVASSSASASASAAAAFQIPGKKLSVLPIGLGIFAGISVIALIVVGLVTYERTKYRKAFRQRKLAEQGQSMGYGGMAQQAT